MEKLYLLEAVMERLSDVGIPNAGGISWLIFIGSAISFCYLTYSFITIYIEPTLPSIAQLNLKSYSHRILHWLKNHKSQTLSKEPLETENKVSTEANGQTNNIKVGECGSSNSTFYEEKLELIITRNHHLNHDVDCLDTYLFSNKSELKTKKYNYIEVCSISLEEAILPKLSKKQFNKLACLAKKYKKITIYDQPNNKVYSKPFLEIFSKFYQRIDWLSYERQAILRNNSRINTDRIKFKERLLHE